MTMIFTEETNYFSGSGGCVDAASMWKPNDPSQQSKLNTWTGGGGGGPPMQRNGPVPGGPFMNGAPLYDDAKNSWGGRPPMGNADRQWSDGISEPVMVQGLENDFGGLSMAGKGPQSLMNGNEGYPMNANGTAHWGRREINQSVPWEVPGAMNRPPPQHFGGDGMPPGNRYMPPMNMDNGGGQWRSWEYDAGGYGAKGDFQNPPPFAGGMGKPGKFNAMYNSNNGPPQGPYSDRMMFNGPPMAGLMQQQQQPWAAEKMGPPNGGYANGGGNRMLPYGQQPNAGPMGMMPPPMNRSMMPPPHMQPPQQMAQQQASAQSFSVGNFTMPNDDAVWHDPNGELRKWQRDTGTGVWGDPAKQKGQPIRLWLQAPEEEEKEVKETVEKEEENNDSGWGELPPMNAPAPQNSIGGGAVAGGASWMPNVSTPTTGVGSGGGWADAQRDPRNFQMPPNQFQSGGNGFLPQNGIPEWSQTTPPTFDAGVPQSNFSERLQMAGMKGLIDMNIVSNAGRLSPTASTLLTQLLNYAQRLEHNDVKMDQLRRTGADLQGAEECDRIANESNIIQKEIGILREKIMFSLEGTQRNNAKVSLAEELTAMAVNNVPPIGGDSIW